LFTLFKLYVHLGQPTVVFKSALFLYSPNICIINPKKKQLGFARMDVQL